MKGEIDRVVAGLAPDPGPGMTPGARDLLKEITAAEPAAAAPPRRPRAGWRISLPVFAGLAAAALLLSWLVPGSIGIGPHPAAAALDVRKDGGQYIITVKDVFADPARYERELRSRGLDIKLSLIPTSASGEGQIMTFNDDITPIRRPGPCPRRFGCQIGVKVPADLKGKREIVLGRKAKPGERFKIISAIDAVGEPLHCVAYVGKPVREVREILRARGVPKVDFSDGKSRPKTVPDSWFVHDGVMSRSDMALLLVGPDKRRPRTPGSPVLTGDPCPKRS